jgi:vancomycin resistance protein VanJ
LTTIPSSLSCSRPRQVVRFLLLAGIDGYALALAIYLLLRLLIGDDFWALAAVNNLAPYYFLPLLVALPLSLLLRARHALLLTVPLAAVGLVWFGPYFLPQAPPITDAPLLRIVTFNVWGDNLRLDDVEGWLRAAAADLVLMQEIPPRYANEGVSSLADLYPYQVGQSTELRLYGQLTLSRYPILAAENLDMEDDGAPTQQRLVIDAEVGPVVVYNVHFHMPVREQVRFHLPVDFWPLGMAARYDDAGRNAQINRLLGHVAAETDPVIVAGDFNMSDQALMYGTVAALMGDSFREAGVGLGGSWPVPIAVELPNWLPPVFRLDYIWHSGHFRAVEAAVGPRLGSDHLPHVATLALRLDK